MQPQSPPLPAAYPVDDRQWSIPSIRLANRVESSGRHLHRGQSSGNFSECTDEEGMSVDESYYSFLATDDDDDDDDDDTASLSSRGSLQAPIGERVRRFSRQFLRTMSSSAARERGPGEGGAAGTGGAAANAVFEPFQHPAPAFPAATRSNSFLERMRGISIEGASDRVANVGAEAAAPPSPPPLPRRARTFDCESPPPVLDIDVDMTEDDDAVDYYRDGENPDGMVPPSYSGGGGGGGVVRTRESTSGRRRQRRRRHRKEGAAVEWIQDLQSRSNEVRQIAESASSRFLTGDVPAPGGGVATASAGANGLAPHANAGLTKEEVARALGMPHPLCRSSTIEAGPLTLGIHRGGLYGRAGNVDVAPGGGNNSIALTSSGSGD